MHLALGTLSEARFAEIEHHTPKAIRASMLGESVSDELIAVDKHWSARPVDVSVGNYILLPHGVAVEGACCERRTTRPDGEIYQAVAPGVGRFESTGDWAAFVRVSRRQFEGRNIFRHLEEVEHD